MESRIKWWCDWKFFITIRLCVDFLKNHGIEKISITLADIYAAFLIIIWIRESPTSHFLFSHPCDPGVCKGRNNIALQRSWASVNRITRWLITILEECPLITIAPIHSHLLTKKRGRNRKKKLAAWYNKSTCISCAHNARTHDTQGATVGIQNLMHIKIWGCEMWGLLR